MIQHGFARGRAVVVVTLQAAVAVFIPVIAGFFVFVERLAPGLPGVLEIAGMILALAGSIVLSWSGKNIPVVDELQPDALERPQVRS